jgi:hypothetical protein
MDWKLLAAERSEPDPYGLTAFLHRLEDELGAGDSLTGFTFLNDAREMLAFSRNIEQTMLASDARGPLYVGFQTAAKLEGETERYRHMFEHRVQTHGFGTGNPAPDGSDVVSSWTSLPVHHAALENQWLLVTSDPEPIAFVGWEVSDRTVWGEGGISASGKVFVGFVSDEKRVVDAIIQHLETVRAGGGETLKSDVAQALSGFQPKRTMIVVDDGKRPYLRRAFEVALNGAFGGSNVYLFDLSAASYLVNPYPNDEDEWRRPHTSGTLRRALGRSYLADLIDELAVRGIEAEAVLPEGVGFKRLAESSDRLGVDLVVLPEEFTRPALIDRLRGNSVSALGSPRARVIVERAELSQHEGPRTLAAV